MKLNFGTWSLTPYLIVVLLVGLQACGGGGGGSSTPVTPANANPIGYYAGTLSTVSPSQTDITAKAIVDSDKFLLVHIDNTTPNTLLYKGTFTNITATTFTADVRIYRNGAFLRPATISNGSITEKASMSGTLSGTGEYSATSFSITYDTTINARSAPIIIGNQTWVDGTIADQAGFLLFSDGVSIGDGYGVVAGVIVTELEKCGAGSTNLTNINSEAEGRIRKYAAIYPDTCSNITSPISMTGYITPFDSAGGTNDDRYLWIISNDTLFFAAEVSTS